ncbi:hypothetical protein J3R82DRAFT_11390 [Butyriboletus roseoflavus]|nr:hypothetical protein J3R82DRAFT_11390 [Butyriboletus roseoflavus]
MAPPTRLRPHLNDLLQKNLELEHVVADLRHQLTQSSAKWADERKTLAVGCDALMASFAKFRARLDVHPSNWGDLEGAEVEQNLDAGRQSEEIGGVDNGMLETEGDHGSSVADDFRERCHALTAELQVKEEELEECRRKHEAAEEELQRAQRSLKAQSEQLRTAALADTHNRPSSERTLDCNTTQANPSKTELEDALEKLDLANQEVSRLKQLLQQWQKYGNDWKRDAQSARVRASELELRETSLSAQVKTAEESRALLDVERKETQRLTSALADQTAAVEHQRTLCQESVKRVQDLEATVALLLPQLSPEQHASFGSGQNRAALGPSNSTQSPTPHADTNTNKRSDMIVLKIPFRKAIRRPSGENNRAQDGQQHVFSSSPQQSPAGPSVPASPVPQTSNTPLSFNSTDFELCIHTCNPFPCRNESQSFLWLRKQASLPRHALSAKKHFRCTPECLGHRLLTMTVAEALKEPRSAKCRPPTEAELALAAEEVNGTPNEATDEQGTGVEGISGAEGSGEPEEPENPEGSASEDEIVQEKEEEQSPRKISDLLILGKRRRSRITDVEETQRARKLRPRISITTKP